MQLFLFLLEVLLAEVKSAAVVTVMLFIYPTPPYATLLLGSPYPKDTVEDVRFQSALIPCSAHFVCR